MTDGAHTQDHPDIREKGLPARLAAGEPILADGAMGTLLMARGLEPGAPPEEWHVAHPRRIADVHRAHISKTPAGGRSASGASATRLHSEKERRAVSWPIQ